MLKTRVKTACVFVPICALILFFSDRPFVLNTAVALLNIGAAWAEIMRCSFPRCSSPRRFRFLRCRIIRSCR